MIRTLRRLFRNADATAAVETAIFAPIFLTLTLGITDIGGGVFTRMSVNAAAQSGAAFAVINNCSSSSCSGIQTAMNQAANNPSFCSGTNCTVSVTGCADGSPRCVVVTASYPWTPILPTALYSWTQAATISSTVTIRVF